MSALALFQDLRRKLLEHGGQLDDSVAYMSEYFYRRLVEDLEEISMVTESQLPVIKVEGLDIIVTDLLPRKTDLVIGERGWL